MVLVKRAVLVLVEVSGAENVSGLHPVKGVHARFATCSFLGL